MSPVVDLSAQTGLRRPPDSHHIEIPAAGAEDEVQQLQVGH